MNGKSLIAVLAGMIIVWQRTDSAAIKVRLLTLWTNSGGFDDTTFGVTIAEPPQQV